MMKKMPIFNNLSAEKGVTLVEVLVSLLLFSVLVVSLLYGFNTSQMMAKNITYRASAMNLAQDLMEQVKADTYSSVTSSAYSGLSNITVSDGIVMSRSVTVSAEYTYPSMTVPCKDVTVTISWTESGQALTESLFTIITEGV